MVQQKDRVKVNGVEATVETWWGAGKHRIYRLSDGREIQDLHLLIALGKAEIFVNKTISTKPFQVKELESLPNDDDDFEE